MKDELKGLDRKLDKIIENINDSKVDIAQMKVDIAHHIKRTDLLEQDLRTQSTHTEEFKDEFLKHTSKVRGATIFIGALIPVIGVIIAAINIIK